MAPRSARASFSTSQWGKLVTTLFDRVQSVERRKGQIKAFDDMGCWQIVSGGIDRFGMATRGGRIVIWRCSPRREPRQNSLILIACKHRQVPTARMQAVVAKPGSLDNMHA